MNRLAWGGIAYAVYLGVKNWQQLQQLEETVASTNRLMVAAFGEAGKLVK